MTNKSKVIVKHSSRDEDLVFAIRFSGLEIETIKSDYFSMTTESHNYSGIQEVLSAIKNVTRDDITKTIEFKKSNKSLDEMAFKYQKLDKITFFQAVLFANFYKKALETGKHPLNFFEVQSKLKQSLDFKEYKEDSFLIYAIYVGEVKEKSGVYKKSGVLQFDIDLGFVVPVCIEKHNSDFDELVGRRGLFVRTAANKNVAVLPLYATDGSKQEFILSDAEVGTLCETENKRCKVVQTYDYNYNFDRGTCISTLIEELCVKDYFLYFRDEKVFVGGNKVKVGIKNGFIKRFC